MYERIVEIIAFVMSELKHKKQISEINIEELQKKGYSENEISTAFSWVADRFELAEKHVSQAEFINKDSFRILHEGEKELFTKEALGDLFNYHSLGLLSNEQVEILIENTMLNGFQIIDSLNLKYFVAN
ncbi:DUF494 family protein, partial [Bacteroidetes/Chlorobi group bacterium ChocPot_Mid]